MPGLDYTPVGFKTYLCNVGKQKEKKHPKPHPLRTKCWADHWIPKMASKIDSNFHLPCLEEFGSKWPPTSSQYDEQNRCNRSMPFKIDLLRDVGGFGKGQWRQVGTKFDQKLMSIAKSVFLKNRALAAAGARFLWF